MKSIFPNACDTVWDRDAGKTGAVAERPVLDAGDGIGDRDAGKIKPGLESPDPDAGDAAAVDPAVKTKRAVAVLAGG